VGQVYGARTWGWRGTFGVHTWVAVKAADARWYGSIPELYADQRRDEAAKLIPRIDAAARSYPYPDEYQAWPGPNSNTFTAWITRAVPELGVDLPPTAIGKDYLGGAIVGPAPSGRGLQLSLGGLLAITASGVEGLELNLLGLSFGINPFDPALKLPLLGRIGPARP
jgi:uncharacterized protein DUF3750